MHVIFPPKTLLFLMDDQLKGAPQAKQEKKEVNEGNSQEKRMTLLNNQIQHLRKENQLLKQRLDSLVHSDINKTLEENIILNDLFLNSPNKNSKNKDCKPETINLALQIKLVSSKAYEILANNLPFPSSS